MSDDLIMPGAPAALRKDGLPIGIRIPGHPGKIAP